MPENWPAIISAIVGALVALFSFYRYLGSMTEKMAVRIETMDQKQATKVESLKEIFDNRINALREAESKARHDANNSVFVQMTQLEKDLGNAIGKLSDKLDANSLLMARKDEVTGAESRALAANDDLKRRIAKIEDKLDALPKIEAQLGQVLEALAGKPLLRN